MGGAWIERAPPRPMRRNRAFPHLLAVAAACLAAVLLLIAGRQPSGAGEPYDCRAARVVVVSASRADAIDACAGARAAIGFFRSLGLESRRPISIEVLARMPESLGASGAGAFIESERRVMVLSYERFKANGTWFRIPIDRRLYRSVATHEVAHAIASEHFRVAVPTIEAKEYIAYVATFSTMDESQRSQVLAAFPGEGFDDACRMSTTIYLFDPMRFGVEAYRHYLKPGNGNPFLRAVLAGTVLAEP
jgi:hypothetical protein